MRLFYNDSKQQKAKKQMELYKKQMEDSQAKYESAKKAYEQMTEEEEAERSAAEAAEAAKAAETAKAAEEVKAAEEAKDAEEVKDAEEAKTAEPEEERKSVVPDDGMQRALDALGEKMNELSARIGDDYQRLLKENADIQERLDQKQERLEQIMQATQEDRYKKDKIKLVNKYIYQMDLIRKVLYDFDSLRKVQSEKESVAFLERQLTSIVVSMEATLAQEMVESIQCGEHGGTFNPELQESIDTVATDNPELDGKIYASINPGYVWTLPYILKAKITDKGDEIKSYRFLVRPEQVIIYRLNK